MDTKVIKLHGSSLNDQGNCIQICLMEFCLTFCQIVKSDYLFSQYRVIWDTLTVREKENRETDHRSYSDIKHLFTPFSTSTGFWLFHCGHGERSQGVWIQHSWRKGIQNGFVRVEIGRRWTSNKKWKDEGKNSLFSRIALYWRQTPQWDGVLMHAVKQTVAAWGLPSFHYMTPFSKGLVKHYSRIVITSPSAYTLPIGKSHWSAYYI